MSVLLCVLSFHDLCNGNAIDDVVLDTSTTEISDGLVRLPSADRQNLPAIFCPHHDGRPDYGEAWQFVPRYSRSLFRKVRMLIPSSFAA